MFNHIDTKVRLKCDKVHEISLPIVCIKQETKSMKHSAAIMSM